MAPEVGLGVLLIFGYGVVIWGGVAGYSLFRYALRRHPLSLLGTAMPLGLVVLNLLFMHLVPSRWFIPVVITLDVVATVMMLFMLDDLIRGRPGPDR